VGKGRWYDTTSDPGPDLSGWRGAATTRATRATRATKAISLVDATAEGRLRSLIREVATSGDEVIVEEEGLPAAVINAVAGL